MTFLYQAILETVARVKPKKNETKEDKYAILLKEGQILFFLQGGMEAEHVDENYKLFLILRSFQLHTVFNLDNENRAEDTPTLIDRKVCLW